MIDNDVNELTIGIIKASRRLEARNSHCVPVQGV